MAKRLKVPMSVLLGEKLAETVIEDGSPRASAPAEDEDPAEEIYMRKPCWFTGQPESDGRYFARIDMGDGGVHEAVGEYRGGSWSVFGGPLYEKMQVVGWWPLPEKG